MFSVLTEKVPPRYWLVCGICGRRWQLEPEDRLLPQTREVFAEHASCRPHESDDGG